MSLPPLVDLPDGAELDEAERTRYARHLSLAEFGPEAQLRLRTARVLVVGAGGLGAPVLAYLAAAGIGTIGIVDPDRVEVSNLQRQVLFGDGDIGRAKVEAAAAAIQRTNPSVTVRAHPVLVDATNALELIGDYHLVIDGTDNFAARYLLNDACTLADRPYVWGSILGMQGQLSVAWASRGPQLRDLYPEPPAPGAVPSCADAGVLGALCGTVGSLLATEAVKLICGIGEPLLGRVVIYDALEASVRTVRVQRDPAGAPIRSLAAHLTAQDGPVPAAAQEVSPDELLRLLGGTDRPTLIDVREPQEYDAGHIPGARLLPLAQLLADPDAATAADPGGDRAQPNTVQVIVYCRSGQRSATAARALAAVGGPPVRQLRGGMLAWRGAVDTGS
ncbi:ThiF family adenylyltransferase [Nakamurella aerolata]|uniref:Adenylyltransferase/sulfurtransferase MoeZ n=1 Tax=Nakamurella aerolata TaxID=1656892 RepID=A0A849A4W4_9ACTN|nr:ThiF family adenylyltransferase [Nakamurella aerolata]NNG34168.1 adenylyltransferase/sulfurtransferase MoeZ [Nakamurella aerolata]